MKLTPELKLRAAIHLLCQANPGSTFHGMREAVEQLAEQILTECPNKKRSLRTVAELSKYSEPQNVAAAIKHFETKIPKPHRS